METMSLVSKSLPRQFIKINVSEVRGSLAWKTLLKGEVIVDSLTGVPYSRINWAW